MTPAEESPAHNRTFADDQTAFESFHRQYVKLFIQFGFRFIPDMEAVRDIVQEAFIGLWNHREMLGNPDHAKAFLYRTIHNRAVNALRNRQVAARHAENLRQQSDEGSFRDIVIETEMYEFLCRKIEALPEMQQKVIWLHSDGLTNEEIAHRLGISVNTVLTHKQRAKKVLREWLSGFSCAILLDLL